MQNIVLFDLVYVYSLPQILQKRGFKKCLESFCFVSSDNFLRLRCLFVNETLQEEQQNLPEPYFIICSLPQFSQI